MQDGDCTVVSGDGSVAAPYQVDATISPDADNQTECRANGLYTPPTAIQVDDTDCIDLEGDGTPGDPITAEPILAADVCNLTECSPDGLNTVLNTQDTSCIDLEGCGTPGDPLTADPILSGLPGNTISCAPDGLFVPATPPASPHAITPRATLSLTPGLFSIPPNPGSTLTSIVPIPWDIVAEDIGGIADIPSGGFTVPLGGDGVYYVSLVNRDNPFSGNDSLTFPGLGFTFGVQLFLNGGPFPGVAGAGLTQARATKSSPQSIHLQCDCYVNLIAGDTITSVASMHVAGGIGVPHVFLAGNMFQIARLGDF